MLQRKTKTIQKMCTAAPDLYTYILYYT